jgi:capsular polysaccharide biosynthesis protein
VIVKSIISPPFLAPPPLGLETIDPRTQIPPAQLPAWSVRKFPPKQVDIHLIEDAWLFPRGLVLAADGKVVNCTIALQSAAEVAGAQEKYESELYAQKISGDNVLCIRPGFTNYGHFIVELLPNAPFVQHAFPTTRFRILCGNVGSSLRAIYQDAFNASCTSPVDVMFVESFPVRVERLFIVEGLSVTARYTSPLVSKTIDMILSNCVGRLRSTGRRIFVPRDPPMSRSISNRRAVDALMTSLRFETVNPAKYSFSEQVKLFANTDEVVGVIGAALTNTIFCRPGTKIVSLVPVSMFDTFYWRIACIRSLKYYEIRCCEDVSVVADRSWNRPIIVPIERTSSVAAGFLQH